MVMTRELGSVTPLNVMRIDRTEQGLSDTSTLFAKCLLMHIPDRTIGINTQSAQLIFHL